MLKLGFFTFGGITGLITGIWLRDKGFTSTAVNSYYKFNDNKRYKPLNIDEDQLQLKFNKLKDIERIAQNVVKEKNQDKYGSVKDLSDVNYKHKQADEFFDYTNIKK